MEIKIASTIPLPGSFGGGKGGRTPKYPWRDMEVGQSFFIGCPNVERVRIINSLTSCRRNAQMKTGFRFMMAQVPNGVRVWRKS